MAETMEIQHPLHHHPLKLVPLGETSSEAKRACAGCDDDELSGKVYACESCGLYLHQSCANLPLRIEHFIHPGCPLFLKLVPQSRGGGGEAQGLMLWYQCRTCNFGIDAGCGHKFLQSNSSEEPSFEEEEDGMILLPCGGCEKRTISGNHQSCRYCGYSVYHECGGNLPRKIQHFYHPSCTLSLQISYGTSCDGCGKQRYSVFMYHCKKCDFSIDVECTKFQPIRSEDEGKRVQHLSHHHPLKLSGGAEEEVLGRNLKCKLCGRKISGQNDYAACESCDFHIHKSCMGIPWEIEHRCHPHPLWLNNKNSSFCYTCSADQGGFLYQCKKCKFEMCVECVIFSEEVAQGDKAAHILHFCHHHPLQLFKDPKKDRTDMLCRRKLECLVCDGSASGLTYGCKDCDVYLHKSCLDILPQTLHKADGSLFLQREFGSLFRRDEICMKCQKQFSGFRYGEKKSNEKRWCVPCALEEALSLRISPSSLFCQLHFHPCSLTLKLFPTFTCNICFTHCHTHAYYCDQCDFYVGIKCAQMSMKSSHGREDQIRHFCHWHPLQLSQDTEVSSASCKICGSFCTQQPFYFCSDCDFHIHKSCLDILPQQIDKHYFNCSLVLLTSSSYKCVTCQNENISGLAFRSTQSGTKICMRCVIWPENKLNDDDTYTSIHHWHQLEFADKLEKDANCLLCRSKVSKSAYYCSECKDYFHKACAELPLEMQHPLHKQHPLTLISSHLLAESSRNCSLCQGDLLIDDPLCHHSGVYHCEDCGFQLDIKCATGFPSIQYQGHPHLLTVVENMQGQEVCHVCKASCINNMVFRCAEAECKFSLHLSCGPLPCNVKHSCHVHPLILEEFYVEENYTDLFPCHVCEERRDPRLPVYCCGEGCPMICEIECLISEVMPKLLGAHGDVELRTVFPNVVSKVITRDEGLTDITYDSGTTSSGLRVGDSQGSLSTSALDLLLSQTEEEDISLVIDIWEHMMRRSHGIELEREDEDMFTFTRDALGHFSSKLGSTQFTLATEGIPEFISQHNGPAVGGELVLPGTLIPIYEKWFGQNSTIGATFGVYSKDNIYKSFFVFMLCAVLHNMRTTKLVDVTNERVLQWLTIMKLVELAEYRISIISDRMKRVWENHFLIKAKAIVDDKSARLDRRHKELSRREEELLRELKDIRREKEEVQKEEEVHHKYAGDGMRSLRKEYAGALLMKWKPAIDSVLGLEDLQWIPDDDGGMSGFNV